MESDQSDAVTNEGAEPEAPAVDWETGAAVRVVVFLCVFLLLGILGAFLAPAEADAVGETVTGNKPTAAPILMTFMVTHLMPVIIMLGACARALPPGERMRSWQFDKQMPNLPGRALVWAAALALGVSLVQFGWGFGLKGLFDYSPVDPYLELLTGGDRNVIAAIIIGAVLAAPVAEEMFFRRVLHRALWRRIGETPADILTSVLFSAAHFSILGFPGLFVFGYVQQRILRRSGSLALPILTHAIYNALIVGWLLQEVMEGAGG